MTDFSQRRGRLGRKHRLSDRDIAVIVAFSRWVLYTFGAPEHGRTYPGGMSRASWARRCDLFLAVLLVVLRGGR